MPQRQYYQNVLQHLASTQEQEVFPTNHHTHRERETITDLLMEAYVRETNETPFLFEIQTNIIVEDD